jgi:hypothetical protein
MMLWRFIKSTLVGLVTLVIGIFVGVFLFMVGLWVYAAFFFKSPAQSGDSGPIEVGWDVVTIFKNYEVVVLLFLFLAFTVGFVLGFRHFAKSQG